MIPKHIIITRDEVPSDTEMTIWSQAPGLRLVCHLWVTGNARTGRFDTMPARVFESKFGYLPEPGTKEVYTRRVRR